MKFAPGEQKDFLSRAREQINSGNFLKHVSKRNQGGRLVDSKTATEEL